MLKKHVTYTDFDNVTRTEELYFNLTQTELLDFAMELPDGVVKSVGNDPEKIDNEEIARNMLSALGGKGIVKFLKTLLLKSYGVKSEDGRRFIKSEKISEEFSQTLAFDAIFMELLSNDEAASDFVNGVIPAAVVDKMPMMQKNKVLPMK